ncbi:MAG: sulfatase [Myxococcales bacterium]|nr:sulfatase [Myxococcales bacterium]
MTPRHRIVVCVALACAACGKSTKEPAATEPKVTDVAQPGAPANKAPEKPAAPPVKAASRGPERPVYSLVDNRLSAHLSRGGGLLLPAGSAGFAKYVRIANMMRKDAKKSWDLRQTEGEIKVARLTGKSGAVFVPLTAAQAGRSTLRIRAFAKADGVISVRINNTNTDEDKPSKKEINGKLTAGWSTAELALPEGTFKEGENAIQIFTKESGVAVAWLQVAAQTPVADDGATRFYDSSTKSLLLPKDGAMTWFAAVPEKAQLTGDLADGNCKVHVVATAEDGGTAAGDLVGTGSAVDLGALAGKAARIDLEGVGCNETQLASAALVIPGEPVQVKRGDAPKHVVFIIMDSLRADRVRPFNPKARPEAPNWEKLAESSAVFMNTYQQGNESQVSHAAIWSANYLAKHRASEMKDRLADKWTTIDEVAKKAGTYVAGASGNGYIRPARGFGSAWDQYVNHIEKSLGLKGADIMEKGLSFVSAKKTQPWFLYLGFIDTHVTWRAKQPWMDKYDGGYKGRFTTEYGDDGPNGSNGKDLTDKEKDHVRALYDSNVSYQDELLGQLVEKLKNWGVYDQTMIIITADHGDEQWEDGRVGHGGSQRETLVHVPLLIHYPPLFPTGRVTEGAEGIDIVPTLADALGVATDSEWQGASLIPIANGAGGYPLMSFSSQYENGHVGRIGHWKLKLTGTGAPHLYNLGKDRDERKDLWGSPTAEIGARMLLDPMWILRQWNVEWKKSQWGNAAAVSNRFASDLGE